VWEVTSPPGATKRPEIPLAEHNPMPRRRNLTRQLVLGLILLLLLVCACRQLPCPEVNCQAAEALGG
jgi:hypothetical protein